MIAIFLRTHYLYSGIGKYDANKIRKNNRNFKKTDKNSIYFAEH